MNRLRFAAPAAFALALSAGFLIAPSLGHAQIGVEFSIVVDSPPPPLPIYEQPPIPGDGYLWTPGYWAWDEDGGDYYWVPGTWVQPPNPGLLWTPGYWGFTNGRYGFSAGYWGPQVGFYGGVNYGFGYGGGDYEGGEWREGRFFYNTSVNNVSNVHITNVYNKTVVNNVTVTKVSYSGGPEGVKAQPTAAQLAAARAPHAPPTAEQVQHRTIAKSDPSLKASVNHGRPTVAATSKPGELKGPGVVTAKAAGGPVRPTAPARTATKTQPDRPATSDLHAGRGGPAPSAKTPRAEPSNPQARPAVRAAPASPRAKPEKPSAKPKTDREKPPPPQ